MIKKTILIIALFLLVAVFALPAKAQTPTGEPDELTQTQKQKIEDLKERVATKVAQMRTPVYKVILGEIKSVDKDSLVSKTRQGEKKILLTEETKIFVITRGKKTPIPVSNLKVDDRIATIGSTDPQGAFVAKWVLAKPLPRNIHGVIEKIDRSNATISVKTGQGTTYVVDIETTTKIQSWKGGNFEKLGLSKLNIGDRLHVHGLKVEDEENRISAVRILVLPGATPSISPEVSPTKTPTP